MNWIQWYYAFLLVLSVCFGLYNHGDPRRGDHDFRVDFVALILHLPIVGRIMGWW